MSSSTAAGGTTYTKVMAGSTPPLFQQALAHLAAAAKQHGVAAFDPLTTPFARLQPLVGKLPDNGLLIVLGAMLGARIANEHGAFWFPQREATLGAALGFPDALIAVTPLDLAQRALATGDLAALDRQEQELRTSLAAARGDQSLDELLVADDYRALFDPAFVYFLIVDPQRVAAALALPAARALELVRDAIASAATLLPNVRASLDAVWATPLARLQGSATLNDSAAEEPRAIESFVRLYAGVASSGAADESFWADAVFPLVQGDAAEPAAAGARLLGVFGVESAMPVVPTIGKRARLYLVEASDLPARLHAIDAAHALAPELLAIANKRLAELDELRARTHAPSLALAFRRVTEAELPHEAAAPKVSDALRS